MEFYYYDTLGKLTKYVLYYDDSVAIAKAQISYDSLGRKTDSIIRYSGRKSETEKKYRYDTNKNLVAYVYIDADSVKSKSEYFYNPERILEREIHIYNQGKIIIYYDNLGNKYLTRKFNQTDSLVWEQKRVLEYDDNSNVIKCVIFENDSKTEYLTSKIDYY